MTDLPEFGMRRRPTQARSRERVQRILDTAAQIVESSGFEALSVAALARRAEVPVGTIYQFFESKDEIVQALAERYVQGVVDLVDSLASRIASAKSWSTIIDLALRAHVDHFRSTAGLRAIWVGARVDPAFVVHDHVHNNPRVARRLAALLHPLATVPLPRLETMVVCAWEAGQALLEQAFRLDADGDPSTLRETRDLLTRYLAPAFEPRQMPRVSERAVPRRARRDSPSKKPA